MAVIAFVPADFKAAYPEFTATPDARTVSMFTIAAQSILDNTTGAPVMDENYRIQLFFMLVAHMLVIFGPGAAGSAGTINAPPGRLSSATEGTVSTSFEYLIPQGSAMAAWFNQTKYGAMFWMATAQFRSAKYYGLSSGVGFARAYGQPLFNVPGGI